MERFAYIPAILPDWYAAHARALPWRQDREPYHVWISEIMLQQTRVEAVIGYYLRFLRELPTVQALAAVEDDQLMKLWEGLGYYNRARNLKKAAQLLVERYHGVFPAVYDEIRALPGVGAYTAGAIASICFDLPTPAVDGNVLRVCARLNEDGRNIDKETTKKQVAAELQPLYRPGLCGILTQSLMELGACVCVPNGNPKCTECPLAAHCLANAHTSWAGFPVRDAKKQRKRVEKTVLFLKCGDRYAVRKRKSTGLLANLWEFPNVDTAPASEDDALRRAAEIAADWGTSPAQLLMQTAYTHIFTHVEWHMTCYYFECREMPDAFVWASAAELQNTYALPSAFRPFLDAGMQL
ncbi:MAG: A/G-specific adenine glycosylase [Clostridia bacterium]|nr:A/G-specific adenine glycosylase [Clostridia bacterium]